MTELLTAAQMRTIETAAIESGAVSGLALMERAGRGVVEAIFEAWPELASTAHRAAVLCGPGNNGGDGFVVARLLKDWGWQVALLLYGDPAKLPPDAKANHARWDGPVHTLPDMERHFDPEQSDLIVDALFGTGLARGLARDAGFGAMLPDRGLAVSTERPAVVAVDIPSGLCSDSGKELAGDALWADLTVSFHTAKPGHFLGVGPSVCGRTVVKSIGLEGSTGPAGDIVQVSPGAIARLVERPGFRELAKRPAGHKYVSGHALVLSGPPGTGGAARLAARGALRIGAGLVSVVCEDAAVPEHAARLDAVMIKRANGAGDLTDLLADPRFNALCLGPGLGPERARELVPVALHVNRASVLDADALTAFQPDPDQLFALLHETCVLTPHAGEFKRLFPDIAEKLATAPTKGPAHSKVDATRDAALRAGCVVLFKGPDTVISDPSGRASISSAQYDRTAPWLATAGAGDVLAGFITGLLARGVAPMRAAELAAWLHVETARSYGPGLIAEDLPEELPNMLRALAD